MQQAGVYPVVTLPLQSLGVASATSVGLPEATEGDRTAFPGHGRGWRCQQLWGQREKWH